MYVILCESKHWCNLIIIESLGIIFTLCSIIGEVKVTDFETSNDPTGSHIVKA